jgi:DNA primase
LSHGAAERAGLLAPRKSGTGHYDRFRHRLMFAILDLQSRVIGFSGRSLPEPNADELGSAGIEAIGGSGEPPAKYVNTPESPIYQKREAVFGLYQARQTIRSEDECIVVEGNFDVVSLHARGLKNVVAPLGTAFTVEQAKLIKRFAPRVVLLFDGDPAGQRAVHSSREACQHAGLVARVATLPAGTDPDDFARTRGVEAVRHIVRAARGMLEHLIDEALDQGFSGVDAQARAAKITEVTDLLRSETDPAVRTMAEAHADRIVARLGVTDARSFRALSAVVHRAVAEAEGRLGSTGASSAPAVAPPRRARSRDRRDEIVLEIFGALLDYPELLDTPELVDGAELLEGDAAAALAALRQARPPEGSELDPEQILAKLASSIHPFARARLAAPRHERLDDAKTELRENIKKLKALEHARQSSHVVGELERASKVGDFDREVALLQEHMRRARERHGVGER